jgi:hypothetical protein
MASARAVGRRSSLGDSRPNPRRRFVSNVRVGVRSVIDGRWGPSAMIAAFEVGRAASRESLFESHGN